MAEHRVYLASCGLFLAAGDGISDAECVGRTPGTLALARPRVDVLAGSALVRRRHAVAKRGVANPSALWRESVDLAPTHYRPRLLLGEALQDEGRRAEAAGGIQTAIQLRPSEPDRLREARASARLGRANRPPRGSSSTRRCTSLQGMRPAQESIAVLDRLRRHTGQPWPSPLTPPHAAAGARPGALRSGLIWTLVRTDFKARYHGTFGGFVWALLKPPSMFLVLMGVFSFLFASNPDVQAESDRRPVLVGFLRRGDEERPDLAGGERVIC